MVAAGADAGGAQAAVVGVNAAADWVPVVGEVVIVGAAVYFAQERVRGRWNDIVQWNNDLNNAVDHGASDQYSWAPTGSTPLATGSAPSATL